MDKNWFRKQAISAFLPLFAVEKGGFIIVIVILLSIIFIQCMMLFRKSKKLLSVSGEEDKIGSAVGEQLFDVWPVCVIIFDKKGVIRRINRQLLEDLQLDKDVITGKCITDVLEVIQDKINVLPEFLRELQANTQKVIRFSTNSFIREPQSNISFLIQGALVGIYEGNKMERFVLYFRNILEERTQKHVLNIALSRTNIFHWSYDMNRNLMIIDPRYFDYLGIPTKDYTLTNEEFFELMHPDDRQKVIERLTLQLQGNLYEYPVSYRLRRNDGRWEWFEAQSTYVGQLSDLPFRIVGICMSTQKYKDIEEKLNNALFKARRSDELKSAFLANMSHEIRTPLNAIVGFSTLLADTQEELSKSDMEEYVGLIEKNSHLLMVLISDILDLSKIESNTMEFHFRTVPLNMLLNEIGRAQKLRVQEGVRLIMDLPEEDILISTDPERLGQVINNLINNAIKFTSEGSIRCGYRCTDNDEVSLFVEDTGKGMSPEVLTHVFERFFKGDTFVQGTGLGLAICKTIVKHFKGRIEVTSKEGIGTCFTVVIPLQEVEQPLVTTQCLSVE